MPRALDIRTVVVLFHGSRLLLLQRAPWKTFAPNRWTGLGGRDLVGAARREVFEETDLAEHEVPELQLRRLLVFDHPEEGLMVLLYLTGEAESDRVPSCNEGTLRWVASDELADLDVIGNTAQVLPLLVEDVKSGPMQRVRCGVARYDERGQLQKIVFDDSHLA